MIITQVYFLLLFSKLSISKKYLITLKNDQSKAISGKYGVKIAPPTMELTKPTSLDQTEAETIFEYSKEKSQNADDYNEDLDFSENIDQGINSYITSLSRRSFLRSSKFSKSVSNGLKSEIYMIF